MRKMQFKINKFSDLVKLIEDHDLSKEQIDTLLTNTVGIYIGKDIPEKKVLIEQLNNYWHKYKDYKERPLFLNH